MAILAVAIISALAAVDQIIKHFVFTGLQGNPDITLIPNVLYLRYSENTGAAFGIFQDGTVFLSIISAVIVVVGFYFIFSKKFINKFVYSTIILIIAGGLGNLIDRVFRGFVVDYIYFSPINFPVFNFADMLITIGEIMLLVYIIFFFKEGTEIRYNGK